MSLLTTLRAVAQAPDGCTMPEDLRMADGPATARDEVRDVHSFASDT